MKNSIQLGILLLLCCPFIKPSYAQGNKNSPLSGLFSPGVDIVQDKFEGTTTYTMTGNKVKIDGAVGTSIGKGVMSLMNNDIKVWVITFRLQLENHLTANDSSELAVILKVSVREDAPFYPMSGESLIFLVDGERLALSTEGEFNAERFATRNRESKVFARYAISKDQLETILNADQVDFRIMQGHYLEGSTQTRDKTDTSFEGSFSKKNFKAWQDFYNDYILKTPDTK
ncbi:MAG: hypothetical protein WBG71_10390 [Leeuwenhoekiella sp.]